MLDAYIRPLIDKPLTAGAQKIVEAGLSANQVTFFGFIIGLAGLVAIGMGAYEAGLVLILMNRLADGLDGAVARLTQKTDFGAYIDILTDFIIYSGFVLFFALSQPHQAMAAAFLLFAYMGTGTAFLAYAIIAAKRGMETTRNGEKSFFHLGGIAEGTETILFMILACLYPVAFSAIAVIYGTLCWITTLGRFWEARKTLP